MTKTTKWARRVCIGSGIALASLVTVPAVSGAAATAPTGCYVSSCTTPTVSNNVVPPPNDGGGTHTNAAVSTIPSGSSSLPFTGADIGELAVIGAGAVVIGGVLTRRRRRHADA